MCLSIAVSLNLPVLGLCVHLTLCASCLKFQRNWRIRRHPELIDFPKTWAQNITIYESTRDKCFVCLSGKHIFLLFPFLEKWIWLSTNHWERALFMLCQKLQHASLSVVLTLFVIMLCVVRRESQCVLFVRGARSWGRCVFNYQLVEWLMVRQSSTELQLSVCIILRARVTIFVCVQACMCSFSVHFCVFTQASVFSVIFPPIPLFGFHSGFLDQQGNYCCCYWNDWTEQQSLKIFQLNHKWVKAYSYYL